MGNAETKVTPHTIFLNVEDEGRSGDDPQIQEKYGQNIFQRFVDFVSRKCNVVCGNAIGHMLKSGRNNASLGTFFPSFLTISLLQDIQQGLQLQLW